MLKSIKENKVTSLLLLTMLLGVFFQLVIREMLPANKFIHLSGVVGMSMGWHVYFCFQYLIGFILVLSLLIEKKSELDKKATIIYLIWDIYGFAFYLYIGWPEPVESIVFSYLFTLFLVVVWK